MKTNETIAIILLVSIISAAGLYLVIQKSNTDSDKCRNAGGVTVLYDPAHKPVCLHPGAVIDID